MSKEAISECVKAASALYELKRNNVPPVPKGWFTASEYMKALKCGKTFAYRSLNQLIDNNKLEFKKWPFLDRSNNIFYTTIYKNK